MDLYILILRVVHILSGVVWAGGVLILFAFIEPAVRATAPAGQQVMQYMVTKGRFSSVMASASGLTVLAGALLFWQDSGGLQSLWLMTRPGIAFTLGALFGIAAFAVGVTVSRSTAVRLTTLGGRIQAAGKPPTREQASELATLSTRLSTVIKVNAVLVVAALFFMATARYW